MNKPRAIVHNFNDSLAVSQKLEEESDWVAFYKRIWPDSTAIIRVDANSEIQRQGIDRMIWLPSGKQILVDEKRRTVDYGDILLETISVLKRSISGEVTTEKPGWSVDDSKHCDFIAYAIIPARKCYLLPFQLLKEATRFNLKKWSSRGVKYAKNQGYETANVSVKWDELKEEMAKQMHRKFGSQVELPAAVSQTDQMLFEW